MKRPDHIKLAPDQGFGQRVPPGQFVSKKFPVLTYGSTPNIDIDDWRLRIFGLVEMEMELTWPQFEELPWSTMQTDFHCVTQWSSLDNTWEGVLFTAVAKLCRPKPEARYVMASGYGGYTTNLPINSVMDEPCILAHKQDGQELHADHGWPLRLVVPNRYGWKSAKWLNGLEFMGDDRPGFWEQRGYSNNADPWREERFWPELG